MNTWALHAELVALAESADPELAAVARRVSDAYEYPVDSLVLSPAGELLAHVAAMEALTDAGAYGRMLDAARETDGR